MDHGHVGRSTFFPAAIVAIAAVAVMTRYGWYAALNSIVPLGFAVLWAAVLALACWGAGEVICRRFFDCDRSRLEETVLVLLAGSAVLLAIAGILGAVHLLRPPLLLAAMAGWACRGGLILFRNPPQIPEVHDLRREAGWIVLIVAGGLSLAAATTFAPFYDQWHYHLGFPYQWLRSGTLVTFERQAYSFFPSNMGLFYVYALAGPGPWAAQVGHWWMGVLAAGGSASIAKRLGAGSRGQLLAAALLFATPSFVQMGALAAADLGVAAFAVGAMLSLLRLIREPDRAVFWAAACGAFAGLSAGCKYLALATVVLPIGLVLPIAVFLVSGGRKRFRLTTRATVVFAVFLILTVGPWLARNAAVAGNPVHPYFASYFSSGGDEITGDEPQVAAGIGSFEATPDKVVTALTLGSFSPRGHAGDIGPVHLWLAPLALFWVLRSRRRKNVAVLFTVWLLGLTAWALGPPLGRYLMPVLAVGAAFTGTAWEDLMARISRPVRAVFSVLLFALLLANCNPVRGEYLADQIACLLGDRSEAEYLEQYNTQLEAVRAANNELPPTAMILLVGEPRPYGIDRDILIEDPFRTPLLVEVAENSGSAGEMSLHLRSLGVTHLLWNHAEAARIARGEGRDSYLQFSTHAARGRLEEYLARHTNPLVTGDWWEIRTLIADLN
jgi:4-amino-4-deoxy-L-arabinose transferase-like glycosyltransferase